MHCITPFYKNIDPTSHKEVGFPCGKCYPCLQRRVSGWSFRLMQEHKVSTSGYFITLTYDTDHVPIKLSGYMTLDKSDFQKFIKRLRKQDKSAIKYFAVGEYGGRTMRPHYHAIIFNVYNVDNIDKCWNKGTIHYGTVTEASVGYTLKYMMKKSKVPLHRNDDRQPEFQLMSKGLGLSYLTDAIYNRQRNNV